MPNLKEALLRLTFTPYSLDVEKGKIKELVKAIGDDNPIYTSLEAAKQAGFKGIPVPLTFLQVIDFFGRVEGEGVSNVKGINPVKILHGEQEFEFLDNIYAGDVLTVTTKVIQVETKSGSSGGMDFITTEKQYTNQHDQLVAKSRSTLIHRH